MTIQMSAKERSIGLAVLAFLAVAGAGVLAEDKGYIPAIKFVFPDASPSADGAPIPVGGYRALFVFDSSNLAKLPAGQLEIFTSGPIREYLKATCVKGVDGKTPERRFFDQATDVSKEPQLWQDAMKLPRASVPWLIVSNGKTGYSGPLPANVDATLTLLKKYEK